MWMPEHREAIDETVRFLSLIHFSLDQLKYNYPEETIGDGETAQQTLERLAYEGASWRYPQGVPEKVTKGLAHELALIAEVKYAPCFLTVQDIFRFARQERGILCQGRGSAANSAVCFCLGITEVVPMLVICCSSASPRPNETSRPPSMSTSSTSAAKK